MATKDWELEKEEADMIQWVSKNTGISLFVYRQDYSSGKESEWIMELASSKKTFYESKGKKTKEQALRLAKIYMENHK